MSRIMRASAWDRREVDERAIQEMLDRAEANYEQWRALILGQLEIAMRRRDEAQDRAPTTWEISDRTVQSLERSLRRTEENLLRKREIIEGMRAAGSADEKPRPAAPS